MRRRLPSPKILLVVACSSRKRVTPRYELRLRSVKAAPEGRAPVWRGRLSDVPAPCQRADALYAGEHWRAACEAYRLTRLYSDRAELWIMSGGYGLIPATKLIKSYGATLASGDADSVWRGPADGGRGQCLR